jgi:RNA polymerase sigma-70 factor (ECF subfamily)
MEEDVRPPPDSTPSDPSEFVAARLRGLLFHHRVPVSECEDCVQEAWLALVTEHPDWGPAEARTRAWLCAVARNKALDFHRRLQRHPSRRIQDLPSHPTYDPFARTDREIDQDGPNPRIALEIPRLLNELGEADLLILLLRADGLPYKEIGARLDLDPARIKASYHRIVQRLRKRFTDTRIDASVDEKSRGGGEELTHASFFFFSKPITMDGILSCGRAPDRSKGGGKLAKVPKYSVNLCNAGAC